MVPEGWRVCRVEELGEVVAGKAKNKNGDGEQRPYLRVANVFDGRIDVSSVYSMPFTESEFARYELRHGDVLLNEGQSLDLVGRCSIYRGELGRPGAIQNALIRFRADDGCDSVFAEQLFRWCQASGIFASIATQTTSIAHLGVTRFANLEVRVPPLPEQRKIAAILSSVDEAIEKTQAVIDQVQVVKKGLMQELLTRGLPGRHSKFKQTEIGEIPEEWDVVTLGDIGRLQTGLAKNKKNQGDVEVPYLRVANVQDGHVDLSEVKTVTVSAEAVARYSLRPGYVLFTEGGDADKLGRGTVWDGQISPCLHQNHVFAYEPNAGVDPWFISFYAGSEHGKSYFLDAAKQTTNLASINSTQLKALPLPLPSEDEQREIVSRIRLVLDRFEAEQRSLSALQTLKQSLMSTLLTGELRVTP